MAKDKWEQVGIDGIAQNKPVTDVEEKGVVRKQLDYYIRNVFHTNKIGFAKMVGVSPATVTKWLYTKAMPSTHFLLKIARYTGLDFEEVLDLFKESEQ